MTVINRVRAIVHEGDAQDLIEYALLVGLISLVVMSWMLMPAFASVRNMRAA